MRMRSWAPIAFGVALVVATWLSGMPQSTMPKPPAALAAGAALPQSLVVADIGDLQTLDGTLRVVTNHRRLYGNIYETLATRDPKTQQILPLLATNWEKHGDTAWIFHIRKGVKFHDGAPLTAADVKFSLDRARDPKISQAAASVKLGRVDVVDDYTVRVTTVGIDPLALTRVADLGFIGEKAYFDRAGAPEFGLKPIGTGPYKFVRWDKGSQVVMTANDGYWGGPVPIKNLTFKFIPDAATRVAALLSGEVDIAAEIPPELGARIDSSPNASISSQTDPMSVGVWLKPLAAPLNNRTVRQALNYAVNKDAIVKTIWAGRATALGSPLFPGIFGYDPAVKPYPYDPAKARAMLAQAGYPNGFTFHTDVPIGGVPLAKEAAEAVAGDLARVGVKMEMRTLEWASFLKNVFTPRSEATAESMVLYIKTPSLDGDGILSPTFPCDAVYPAGWNWGVYCNPQVDKLIATEAHALSPKVRERVMGQISQMLHDDAPWIYLYAPTQQFGVKKGLPWKAREDGMIFAWHDLKP